MKISLALLSYMFIVAIAILMNQNKLLVNLFCIILKCDFLVSKLKKTGPRSAVSNVSGYRSVSDCNSRGREFDPGPVPYFRGY